eukprot:755699-Hanusia_phi.AAC.5
MPSPLLQASPLRRRRTLVRSENLGSPSPERSGPDEDEKAVNKDGDRSFLTLPLARGPRTSSSEAI